MEKEQMKGVSILKIMRKSKDGQSIRKDKILDRKAMFLKILKSGSK